MGKYTKEELARGFEEWLIQDRIGSSRFLDRREVAEVAPKEYGILSADCLIRMIEDS